MTARSRWLARSWRWLFACLPLAWGVAQVVRQSVALFR